MNVRKKAFELLCEIILNKKYSNLLLRKELNEFNDQDKRLITSLVYGTMQNYLYVRYLWKDYVHKKIAEDMAILMDMSIYQLVFMDKIPSYAVVNDAVNIAEGYYSGKYKSMINAMLRRFLREERKSVELEPLEKLSIETSHALWLVKMWNKQYGYERTSKICHENQTVPVQCCRVNTLKTSKQELLKDTRFKEGLLAKDALLFEGGNLANLDAYQQGYITIQDESSQCVAELLDPQINDVILDVCAAPGTKTTHIAQLMKDQGNIIAGDIHAHRVELIHHACTRLGLHSIHPQVFDGTMAHEVFEKETFDRILVDAPCSGYGTLKRKNDIKLHMQSSDMDEIIPLQEKILDSISNLLKVNGILVYSTCTLNKKENEKQIEKYLKKYPNYQCISMRTIFPYEYHSDGFFMAKLIRNE